MRGRLLVCVLALAFAACNGNEEQTAQKADQPVAVPVTVVTIQRQDLPVMWEVMGQTQGSREVEIRPRVTGILLQRLYTEGQFVERGTVLFRIDPLPFETSVQQARGVVGQAEADLARTRADVARLRPLFADNAVSKKELDDAVAAMQSAQASLFSARAQLKAAQIDLGYTRIEAPISGVISRAAVSEGSLVNALETLLTRMYQVDPLWVTFSVASKDHAELQNEIREGRLALPPTADLKVELQRQTGQTYERTGQVNFLDPSVDPKTGTIHLRAEFPNPKAEILPGAFVRLRISGATRPDAIVIPQRAVLQGPTGPSVFVVSDGGKADIRTIETGGTRSDDIIVLSGLSDGDRVVVDGVVKLRPGVPVEATPLAAPETAGKAPAATVERLNRSGER